MKRVRPALATLEVNLFIRQAILLQAHLHVMVRIRLARRLDPSDIHFTVRPMAHLEEPSRWVSLSPLKLSLFTSLLFLRIEVARPTLWVVVNRFATDVHLAPVRPVGITAFFVFYTGPSIPLPLFRLARVTTPWAPAAAFAPPAI